MHYTPKLIKNFKPYKRSVLKSCRLDETYIKLKGKWRKYLYRAVDKEVETIEFFILCKSLQERLNKIVKVKMKIDEKYKFYLN